VRISAWFSHWFSQPDNFNPMFHAIRLGFDHKTYVAVLFTRNCDESKKELFHEKRKL
jgi:hypothetical protein